MSAGATVDMAARRAADAASETRPDPPAPPLAVAVERLRKTFDLRPVLRDVSFTLPAGRCLAVLGPNGAGKTTLLRILATLTAASAGSAEVAGLDVRRDAQRVRRMVGYVGHVPLLYEDLTVRENLLFFARMFGLRDGAERADRLLARMGLRARAHDRARLLSRGQSQRVALARGMLHDPPVLLLDEPDTGLDDEALLLLAELVRERATAGQTTLLTTHQLERGLALSDEALVLVGGRLAYAGLASALTAAIVREWYARPRATRRGR
ncbi:MAG: heme ABC exporter ATP-binding protein CcmA [Ktedonobacterales bacterium]|nr:heme ABC exporter ATP-binding protein CcmA [Ktedonobacterales bacterium]